MNGKTLLNFFVNLNFNTNSRNLRCIELLSVPFEKTKFGSHRLSIFLPRFINVVIKNSFQLNFCNFKQFLINNLTILFNNSIKDAFLCDFLN